MRHGRQMLLGALAALALGAGAAAAGAIRVESPWIRTPPNGAPTVAAYALISNAAGQADRLLGASTAVAGSVTPHTMSMTGGVMRMRQAPRGLAVAARGALALAPDGDHLMMTGLKRTLHRGDHVAMTLNFAHAGKVAASFEVRDDAPVQRGLGRAPM